MAGASVFSSGGNSVFSCSNSFWIYSIFSTRFIGKPTLFWNVMSRRDTSPLIFPMLSIRYLRLSMMISLPMRSSVDCSVSMAGASEPFSLSAYTCGFSSASSAVLYQSLSVAIISSRNFSSSWVSSVCCSKNGINSSLPRSRLSRSSPYSCSPFGDKA